MKNSFFNSDDNEFLTVDMKNSQLNKSRSISTDQIITKLQQKNNTLKSQVNKIQRVLSQMKVEEKPRYGISLPQIKPDTIKKQLQNAYKQIKIYEHEIQKRRQNTLNGQTAYVEQVNRIQKLYKQKLTIHQRLKSQLLTLKNQSKQLTKHLKNNSKKLEYQSLETKLSTDIKYMKEKVRDYENRRTLHIKNLQKQRSLIKQMQSQFLKQNPHQTLEAIKLKIFRPQAESNFTNLTPSRSIFEIENQAAKEQSRVSKLEQTLSQENFEKSPQIYANLLNDAKLLKKMQQDYQNKISFLTKQRDQASQKNFTSRNKILQIQYEIQTIQKSILELKKLIDPKIFKPKLPKSQEKQKFPVKSKKLSILHSFKFVQFGQITKNGKRFTDRTAIGKLNSKIVGITVYEKEQTKTFVGLQATYRLQDNRQIIKKGVLNTRLDLKKQEFKTEQIQLQGEDYIKTVQLFFLEGKVVGIAIYSMKNKILKCGNLTGQRFLLTKQQSSYPMCFYGSLLNDGFECFGVQIFEPSSNNQTVEN